MKTNLVITALIGLGLFGTLDRSAESKPTPNIVPSECAALEARIAALEAVIVRTGANGENVEIRPPSLHGSVSLVAGDGSKIVEVAYPVFIPYSVPALGFFGHPPIGQENIFGDWNSGIPDDTNQSFVLGNVVDVMGSNVGYGLFQDQRTNY